MIYLNIKNDIKMAMLNKNILKRDLLRNVINKAQMIVKAEDPYSTFEKINDEIMIAAIRKELKEQQQTNESIPEYLTDAKSETLMKIGILESYLPQQLSPAEIQHIILSIVNFSQNISKGEVMKQVMPILKDKADGKTISFVVDGLLNN